MKWLIFSLILCLGLETAQQDDKQIELHIRVVTADGDPVDQFLLSVTKGSEQPAFGITDQEGRTSISLTIDDEVSIIKLVPFGFRWAKGVVGSEFKKLTKIRRELGKTWHIPLKIEVPVDRDAERIDVEITLTPAISVSGRLINSDRTPLRVIVLGDAKSAYTVTDKNDDFLLQGLARAREQFIYFQDGLNIFRNHITREKSQADCELGNIELKKTEPVVLTTVAFEQASEFAETAKVPMGAMFIAVDGSYAITSKPPVKGLSPENYKVKIPHGSYYVTPGYFVRETWQSFVWDHAESQKEWHGKHPLMRVEITEDESTHSLSVDLLELYTNLIEDMAAKEEADESD